MRGVKGGDGELLGFLGVASGSINIEQLAGCFVRPSPEVRHPECGHAVPSPLTRRLREAEEHGAQLPRMVSVIHVIAGPGKAPPDVIPTHLLKIGAVGIWQRGVLVHQREVDALWGTVAAWEFRVVQVCDIGCLEIDDAPSRSTNVRGRRGRRCGGGGRCSRYHEAGNNRK